MIDCPVCSEGLKEDLCDCGLHQKCCKMHVVHGIQIFMGPRHEDWLFVEAADREQAEELQRKSAEVVPTRRAIRTDDGYVVALFATE